MPLPPLNLLFPGNGSRRTIGRFCIHEFLQFIFPGKTRTRTIPVLFQPTVDIVGDTRVQSCVVFVGEDVYPVHAGILK